MAVGVEVEAFLARLSPGARRELVRVGVECLGVSRLAARLRVSRQGIYRYLEGSLAPRGSVVARLLAVISECPPEKRLQAARILEAEARSIERGLRGALELLGLPAGIPGVGEVEG